MCKDIEGRSNFEKIVTNMGAQLKLPKEDVEGIKLAAMGGCTKRDYLAFDCAIYINISPGGSGLVLPSFLSVTSVIAHRPFSKR